MKDAAGWETGGGIGSPGPTSPAGPAGQVDPVDPARTQAGTGAGSRPFPAFPGRVTVASLGTPLLRVATLLTGTLRLLTETLADVLGGRFRFREVVSHLHDQANRSLPLIVATMGFFGVIFVYQACFQARRVAGDLSPVGPAFLQLVVREFGPILAALMVCNRVATGMAAHLSTMAVTEQIDALRTCNARPVELLLVPRFLASVVAVPVLTILASLVGVCAGTATAAIAFSVHPATFLGLSMVGVADVAVGLAKSLLFGITIPLFSAHAGLSATGGSRGIGDATTMAVVRSAVAVIVLDFLAGSVGYLAS